MNLQPALDPRQNAILIRYIDNMRQVVQEASRVLVGGGLAVFVIGENTVYGTFIQNLCIIETLANDIGLRCVGRHSRELPANRRYLPPPSTRTTALDVRMRQKVVLTLEKV